MKEFIFQSTLYNDLTLEQIKSMLESGRCKIVPSEGICGSIVLTIKYNDDLDIFSGKKSSIEVTEEEWFKIREGMKPDDDKDEDAIINERIKNVIRHIDELEKRLMVVEHDSDGNYKAIDGINRRFNSLFDNLSERINKLSERLDDLEYEQDDTDDCDDCDDEDVINCINTLNTRLDNLVKNVDTMRVNSYRDYKALQDVRETVSNLSNRVESLEEDNREMHYNGAFGLDFKGLNQRVNACKNALTDILKDIDDLQKGKPCDKSSARSYDLELMFKKVMDIDKLDENLTDLKKTVDTLRTNVATDYSTLNTLRDSVRELNGDVSGLTNNYIGVSNRIDILEKTIDRQCIQRRKRH